MPVYEYKPPLATTVEELVQYLSTELLAVYQALSEADALELRETHAEPKRPRDGMIVFADGTNWDPGSGRGLYVRDTTWKKITHA